MAQGSGDEGQRPQEVGPLVEARLHEHDQGELRDAQREHLRVDDPLAQGLGLRAEADAGVGVADAAPLRSGVRTRAEARGTAAAAGDASIIAWRAS